MPVDYKSFSSNGEAQKQISKSKRWWELDGEELSNAISAVIDFLIEHQGGRQTQQLMSARLYGNLSLMGLNGLSYSKVAAASSGMKDRISYNVCQSVVDTICAKMAKNTPKPYFLTSGGDYKKQRKAKKLNQFLDGVFYENDTNALAAMVFRDACVFGDGVIHTYPHFGRPKQERVLSSELFVDEAEGFYGHPRQIHRVKNIDREVVAACYPSKRKAIMECNTSVYDVTGGYENISDVITVRDSIHLPSSPDAKDGRRVVSIGNSVLSSTRWTRQDFPYDIYSWSKRLYGFWGQGLVEQIQNIQVEINKILWVIQRSYHLAGSFKILMENGSKIVKEHLNNDIGAIVTYTGVRPDYVVPPIISPEVYQHLQVLKNSAFEISGISQLSATSQKPSGLDSGRALREYSNIETERFMEVGKAWQRFFVGLAKNSISTTKEIVEEEGSFEVKSPKDKFIQSINWKDVEMDESDYVTECFPVSSLPSDPAGRLQTIQEYMQAGLLTPRSGRRLLDFPDLKQVEELANAQEEVIHTALDKIIEEGVYTAPEPFDDIILARELALQYYADGKQNGLEEEKLEMIRTYLAQIDAIEGITTPAPVQPEGGAMAAPMGPPVSDMIPNIPAA